MSFLDNLLSSKCLISKSIGNNYDVNICYHHVFNIESICFILVYLKDIIMIESY